MRRLAAGTVGVGAGAGLARVVEDAAPALRVFELLRRERLAQDVHALVELGGGQPAYRVAVACVVVGPLVAARGPHAVVVGAVVGSQPLARLDGGDADHGQQGEGGLVALGVDVDLRELDVWSRALVRLGDRGAPLPVEERPAAALHGVLS